jgi:hypothetical protein
MAIAIRGTTPATTITTSNPVSVTLDGTRQPNAGDVLVIIHFNDFYDLSNMPTPTVGGSSTGVTAITNGTADQGASAAHAKSYTFVVGSTGDLTVSVTETGSADEEKGLAVYVLSGVDTATPVDIAGNNVDSASDFDQIAPSVSPTSSDAYLICHTNSFTGTTGTYTPPGGMTEAYDLATGNLNASGATEQLSASGATGTRTFTSTQLITSVNLSIAAKTGGAPPPPPNLWYTQAAVQPR